jgi:hypothetical protein
MTIRGHERFEQRYYDDNHEREVVFMEGKEEDGISY